ncbi:SURF1 family protein [Streptomyces sp. RB6PN25]|uniref:SURF1-like protein n=1 Tax=Streptomyces humicola TaxID=2953240 RepID=A0ABT1Q3A5_9ACTN|nr:SURF1 family protein [Streptomyces humicola]MCQ4084404.1 SURF1 family protein [Streptomyces humicola]
MYRFLLTPRWLGLTLLAVLAIPFCIFMGTWQLSRFDARVAAHQAAEKAPKPGTAPAIPLHDALASVGAQVTQTTSGRNITATGTYDAAHQFLVPGRVLDNKNGFYVLTLLRTSGGALPVVRGWLPGNASTATAGSVPPAPVGKVSVTGVLQAPESEGSDGVDTSGTLPSGQLGMISAATLVNLVPYPVYDGWITLDQATAPMRPVPPQAAPNTGLDMQAFQNLGYTGEWFVFAGFVVFIWLRLVRREAEVQRDLSLGLIPAPGEGDDADEAGDGAQARDAASVT